MIPPPPFFITFIAIALPLPLKLEDFFLFAYLLTSQPTRATEIILLESQKRQCQGTQGMCHEVVAMCVLHITSFA